MTEPRVGRVAHALGFAGLLPQIAAVGWMIAFDPGAWLLAFIYALTILSFLGGIWWGFAMRTETHQATLVGLAVVPSLLAAALAAAGFATWGSGWVLVATGTAILLTLPVDRWLVISGIAPASWMRLRVPLSAGLGGLTIVAGALAGG